MWVAEPGNRGWTMTSHPNINWEFRGAFDVHPHPRSAGSADAQQSSLTGTGQFSRILARNIDNLVDTRHIFDPSFVVLAMTASVEAVLTSTRSSGMSIDERC